MINSRLYWLNIGVCGLGMRYVYVQFIPRVGVDVISVKVRIELGGVVIRSVEKLWSITKATTTPNPSFTCLWAFHRKYKSFEARGWCKFDVQIQQMGPFRGSCLRKSISKISLTHRRGKSRSDEGKNKDLKL